MIEFEEDERVSMQLSRTLGAKTGLCTEIMVHRPRQDDPARGISANGRKPDLGRFLGVDSGVELTAFGKGASKTEAVVTLLGETVERYTPYVGRSPGVEATYEELAADHPMVDPAYFRFHDDETRERFNEHSEEHSLGPFRVSETRSWIAGTDLRTGERTYVPMEMVYNAAGVSERPIFPTTSNGLACHERLDRALVSGLYEVLERDAFVETWFTDASRRRIRTDAFPTENEYVRLNVLELDGEIDVPTLACVALRREEKPPYACCCGSAGRTYREAVASMLWEYSQLHHYDTSPSDDVDPRTITDLSENVSYYANPDNRGPIDRFVDVPERPGDPIAEETSPPDDEDELEYLVSELDAAGVTPIGFDLTPPDIREEGLAVARVVVPELLSLSYPSFPFDAHPKLDGKITTDAPHPIP